MRMSWRELAGNAQRLLVVGCGIVRLGCVPLPGKVGKGRGIR
ncbi:hypothetical protein ACQ4WP_19310 [Janthinobacterium sp. GB4P2]